MNVFIVIALLAFFSTFLQRVTGFGFGLIFMSVMPFLAPSYGEAVALSGVLALVCASITAIQFARYLSWKKLAIILPTFLVTSFIAVKLVTSIDSHTLKKILGAVLILASIYFLATNGKLRLKTSAPVQIGIGTLSGFMGGLFGIQGPPAVIYFLSCTQKKEEYIALAQWYFVIGNIAMTVFRAREGFLTPFVGKAWLAGVGAVLLGLWIGSIVYKKIPIEALRKAVYVLIGIIGLIALIKG